MSVVSMKSLLEAGVHFGHQTRRWNPKMSKFIFTERNGIYIIDLQKTVKQIDDAYNYVRDIVADGGEVLFVGTKKQAQEAIETEAKRCGQHFVSQRWLGGMLTNYKREREKLEKNLGGIRKMNKMPSVLFVVDPKKEYIAVHEAKILGIPVVGIVDTNCDPDELDIAIPGNDDAIRAVKLLTSTIADAVIEANQGREDSEDVYSETENDTEETDEELVSEEDLKEFVENSELQESSF